MVFNGYASQEWISFNLSHECLLRLPAFSLITLETCTNKYELMQYSRCPGTEKGFKQHLWPVNVVCDGHKCLDMNSKLNYISGTQQLNVFLCREQLVSQFPKLVSQA